MSRKITSIKILLVAFSLLFAGMIHAQTLQQRLEKLAKTWPITFHKMKVDSFFTQKYVIYLKQPLDHNHPNGKTFNQRIILSNKGIDKPVVFVTDGYWANFAKKSKYVNELCPILDANQVVVEHRFFPPSVPDTLEWKYLTIKQAAEDDHEVALLLKNIYHGKWLATGISKGGQTAIFYRYYFPKDVDCFIRHKAHNMMFLVGGSEPWGSTSVNLTYQNNCVKFVKKGGSHFRRINNLPEKQKERAVRILRSWMQVK